MSIEKGLTTLRLPSNEITNRFERFFWVDKRIPFQETRTPKIAAADYSYSVADSGT